jgi:hypothetical protein
MSNRVVPEQNFIESGDEDDMSYCDEEDDVSQTRNNQNENASSGDAQLIYEVTVGVCDFALLCCLILR